MVKIEIFGKINVLDKPHIKAIIRETISIIEPNFGDCVVEINFVNSQQICKINYTHRGIDKPTDVLSFPQFDFGQNTRILGTIVICKEEANKRQLAVSELVIHGLLHLLEYDHEQDPSKWNQAEALVNTKISQG